MSASPRHNGRAGRLVARSRRRITRALIAVARAHPGRANGAVDILQEAVPGIATVQGWAYRRWDRVEAVIVLAQGVPVALATLGVHRPDVGASRRGAEWSGWSARVDLRTVPGDAAVLGALVVTRSGIVERLDDRMLRVNRRGEFGRVTKPESGALVAPGVMVVQGWVLPRTTPARVDVVIDGRTAGPGRLLGIPDPNLAETSPLPWAPLAGFEHVVDLSGCQPGRRVRVGAELVALDGGRIALDPVEIEIARVPPTPPVPTKVTTLAERVRVAGGRREPTSVPAPILRLLVVSHQLDLGGGQLYMFELVRHLLIELDVSCLVVSATDGILREGLEDLGAFVHVCGRPPMSSPEGYESLLLELAGLVASHDCNVAFVNTMSCAFGADLAGRLGIPVVWAVHESYPLEEFFFAAYGENGVHSYVRARVLAALASAAAVVFEADATRQLYEVNGDWHRFVTVPYGIPLAEVDSYRHRCDRADLRRAHGFAERDLVLLCMGTYEPRKGQGALAIAFAELAEEFPDAVLVMVGDTGNPYAKAVREVVDRLGLEHRNRLLPVVEDAYAWYAMADAFVTVSDVESLPRSVLEAMAFGLPVLAVDVYGLSELLEDGVTGFLCAPRDLAAVIDGLRRLLGATPAERAGLGAEGSALVRARYESAGYVAAYRRLLRGLVADPRSLPLDLLS